jgi:hypothetical protein
MGAKKKTVPRTRHHRPPRAGRFSRGRVAERSERCTVLPRWWPVVPARPGRGNASSAASNNWAYKIDMASSAELNVRSCDRQVAIRAESPSKIAAAAVGTPYSSNRGAGVFEERTPPRVMTFDGVVDQAGESPAVQQRHNNVATSLRVARTLRGRCCPHGMPSASATGTATMHMPATTTSYARNHGFANGAHYRLPRGPKPTAARPVLSHQAPAPRRRA